MPQPRQFPRSQTERTIAAARVILAASGLLAIWLDPDQPPQHIQPAYWLYSLYILYSCVLAGVIWSRSTTGRMPLVTHTIDIVVLSALQYLTRGPSNPFFAFFVLCCGALRWQWRGALGSALFVVIGYLSMGIALSRTIDASAFEANRFVTRTVYVAAAVALLLYFLRHETRLRKEIERLARWPRAADVDREVALARVLEHAADIIGARNALVAWEGSDEPWMHLAARLPSGTAVSKHPPGEIDPVVPPPLADAVIVGASRLSNSAVSLINRGDVTWEWHGLPVHTALLGHLGGAGHASAPFRTERVSGRVFFSDIGDPTAELMSLTEVVSREIGTSIDQLQVTDQLKELAASEQRVRLARDLHDGVLQSLTGIRFELSNLASTLDQTASVATRDRLLAIERAMANEQRELRLFIDALKPGARLPDLFTGLSVRLTDMRERLALEWKTPITITTQPRSIALTDELEREILLMTHEAVVNALKHANPSRISVDVVHEDEVLRISVRDDGRGFGFRGRYDHEALVESNLGPVSLRERADSLGGRMTIESTDTGSRVEITLPAGTSRPTASV